MKIFNFAWLLLFSALSIAASAPGKVVGKIGMVRGEVKVNDHPVKSGAEITEGSTIEVKKGQATLLLGKGSVIHLASDSKMVVNQFGVTATGEEGGELDLKFGRTRALILNQGDEKKDIKIKARAATMGVRGTEVFISAPQEISQPVSFFTLEGKAEVRSGSSLPRMVSQNEGVVASGVQPQTTVSGASSGGTQGSANAQGTATAPVSGAPSSEAPQVQAVVMAPEQVRNEVQNAGLAPPPIKSTQDMTAVSAGRAPGPKPPGGGLPPPNAINVTMAPFGVGGIIPPALNPAADSMRQITIAPVFESAGN